MPLTFVSSLLQLLDGLLDCSLYGRVHMNRAIKVKVGNSELATGGFMLEIVSSEQSEPRTGG